MGYEESCNRFADLCREVGTAAANRMLDDDPFAGCLYSPDDIEQLNHPCRRCDGEISCSECEYNNGEQEG